MSDYAENAIDATIAHQPSPGERFYPAFEVTPELDAAASEYVTHYPEGKQKSAVLPILHEIQKKFGFISGDAIAWVGEKLNISAAHVLGVVTFYPGLRQMCPGKTTSAYAALFPAPWRGRTACSTPSARVWALTKRHRPPPPHWSQPGRPVERGRRGMPGQLRLWPQHDGQRSPVRKSHSGSAGRSDCQISDSLTLSISHAPDFRHEHHLSSR